MGGHVLWLIEGLESLSLGISVGPKAKGISYCNGIPIGFLEFPMEFLWIFHLKNPIKNPIGTPLQ